MDTILLDPVSWDLVIDASGDLSSVGAGYAIAQDVASQIKLFRGELYYDTAQGVPYFQEILGQFPPLQLIKKRVVDAALLVPEVTQARCYIRSIVDRKVAGQVHVITSTGATVVANF